MGRTVYFFIKKTVGSQNTTGISTTGQVRRVSPMAGHAGRYSSWLRINVLTKCVFSIMIFKTFSNSVGA